jgi:hypothetical protein
MSLTFGALYMNGIQQALPGEGIQGIGPFAVPCSGVQDTQTVTVNTSSTIAIPATAQGVIITPPAGSTVHLTQKTNSGDTGTRINPGGPTFLNFDLVNTAVPSNLYLVSASSVAVVVQFI